MDDLISRQAAIDAIAKWLLEVLSIVEKDGQPTIFKKLRNLPAAEPKMGRWVKEWQDGKGYTRIDGYKCSECDGLYPWKTNYCPNCGADTREVER